MINKVKVNKINTIFYISNLEQYNETCIYLESIGAGWSHDGFYFYRNPINFPFLIFASDNYYDNKDCENKNDNFLYSLAMVKIFDEYLSEPFYNILLRQQKLYRILINK